MFRGFFQRLRNLPTWPDSLYQPFENPTQPGRLPDTTGVELEYPTHRYTPAQDRRHTRRLLLLGALCALLLVIPEIVLSRVADPAHAGLATVGMYAFLTATLGQRRV